jgi:hypothetical protein
VVVGVSGTTNSSFLAPKAKASIEKKNEKKEEEKTLSFSLSLSLHFLAQNGANLIFFASFF